LDWGVLCIIQLLERRCLNRLTWPIWTFETQVMAKRKVGNHPNFLVCRWHVTYYWKYLNKGYNFALDLISIRGLHTKLCAFKVARIPTLGISGLPLGSPETKCHLDDGHVASQRVIIRGKVVAFPESGPWWVLWIWVYPWLVLAPKLL
jgi:hypothetical protein